METRARIGWVFGVCAALCASPFADASDTEVAIDTSDETVVLAGTVSMPEGYEEGAKVPGVVLLSGSGPQDRDSSLFGQTPFRVLADVFNERGFAVLRCDDRGVGGTVGEFQGATIDDFVEDARAMVKFLSTYEGVDWRRVFVLGHSEGAGVAAELAASGDVQAGIVMLGGTAVPGHVVLTDQSVRLLEAAGVGDRSDEVRKEHRALMQMLLEEADAEALLEQTVRLVLAQTGGQMPERFARMQAGQMVGQFDDPWFRRFLEHDPSRAVRRMQVPGLAVYGSLDQQVSDELNASAMSDALSATRQSLSRVVVFPGHNHLFQRARTGALEEYAQLDDLNPMVAHEIADWMERVLESRDR